MFQPAIPSFCAQREQAIRAQRFAASLGAVRKIRLRGSVSQHLDKRIFITHDVLIGYGEKIRLSTFPIGEAIGNPRLNHAERKCDG
jgi:hypothetical protein